MRASSDPGCGAGGGLVGGFLARSAPAHADTANPATSVIATNFVNRPMSCPRSAKAES